MPRTTILSVLATVVLLARFEAGQVNAGQGDASIVHAGLVTPETIAMTIHEGEVTLGHLVEYEEQTGDKLKDKRQRHTILKRNGRALGHLTGSSKSSTRFLRTLDSYQGRRANRKLLVDPDAWTVQVDQQALDVIAAFRKSRVKDVADAIGGRPEVCFEHTIYLRTRSPIPSGTLSVRSADPVFTPYEQELSPAKTRSEAVHVSTVGFRPQDPAKIAVLSCWMGDGGPVDYREDGLPSFTVVDVGSDQVVAKGEATLLREADQPADHCGLQGRPDGTEANYAGTPTFELDFSQLQVPGTYQVHVEGIGTSYPFRIADDVYRPIMELALDGLDAHRWGEDRELKLLDGTTMQRPAAVPARHESFEQVPIFETDATYTNANFGDFEPAKKGPWKANDPDATVIGGYMDAGDFDRNHNHAVVAYWLMDLAAHKAKSDPKLAERLIEASLWDVNFWARLQQKDGGVPSAVEYAEHPRTFEPSWLNSLPIYVCAPSIEGNLHFVTSSAKTSAVLRDLGQTEDADRLVRASTQAMQWADEEIAADGQDSKVAPDTLLFAMTELWNATGEEHWKEKALAILDDRVPEAWSVVYPDGLKALLTILEMPKDRSNLTARQRERFEGSVKHIIQINYLDGSIRRSPFRSLKNGWVRVSFGTAGWPTVDSMCVLRAWDLFPDDEYLAAGVTGLAYCLGGNPNNMVYMTGVNEQSVRSILHCDTRAVGRPAPAGIPIYGPGLSSDTASAWPLNWHLAGDQTIYPVYNQWPTYENVHEFWNWGLLMEYTVHQSHVSAIYLAGMLDDIKAKE